MMTINWLKTDIELYIQPTYIGKIVVLNLYLFFFFSQRSIHKNAARNVIFEHWYFTHMWKTFAWPRQLVCIFICLFVSGVLYNNAASKVIFEDWYFSHMWSNICTRALFHKRAGLNSLNPVLYYYYYYYYQSGCSKHEK